MVSKPVAETAPEFQIQQEDFPALPGAQSKGGRGEREKEREKEKLLFDFYLVHYCSNCSFGLKCII